MVEPSEYDVLTSIVDFYSNRAIAHASFLIASIFGLFSVLSFIEVSSGYPLIALSVTYWLLWLLGLYSFGNFSFYASIAEVAKERIAARQPLVEIDARDNARKRQPILLRKFFALKRAGFLGEAKTPIILLLYMLVGLLPFLAVILL
jgi:hypothetical protein